MERAPARPAPVNKVSACGYAEPRTVNPRRGIGVSSRRGWGPGASERWKRLRLCRAEDRWIRGEASASVRAGGGAPAPVKEVRHRSTWKRWPKRRRS